MKVVWTDHAASCLADIEDTIAEHSRAAAIRFVEDVFERAIQLETFPESGRAVPELAGSGLRELVHGNYRIVYRATAHAVVILSVFEGHMVAPVEQLRREQGPETGPTDRDAAK